VKERTKLALSMAIFAACWFLPVGHPRFWGAVQENLSLGHWYAREAVLLCLVPAFFIAGAIRVGLVVVLSTVAGMLYGAIS
jgi:hypothetical protein